mmetsp:Transcript_128741/g.400549  ORF Transcript_128741/g.400549 Transcript_128741/m.400549 type:complete len:369 (-) Transcript_128741:337-1443(-)
MSHRCRASCTVLEGHLGWLRKHEKTKIETESRRLARENTRKSARAHLYMHAEKRGRGCKYASLGRSKAWVPEGAGPGLDLCPQRLDLGVARKPGLEVLQLLALLRLDLERDLAAAVQEGPDLPEVLRRAAPCRHRRRADADAPRREGRGVAMHGIAVQGDGGLLADLLELRAGEAVGAEVPEDQVVVRPVARQLVALAHEGLRQRLGVGDDGLGVLLEFGRAHLQELRREAADLVVVGPALQGREDGHVDALLDVRDALRVLEEDHASTWTTQRLVGRRGDDVAVLKRRWVLARRHKTGDVRNVRHQQRAHLVRDLPELGKVDDTRVSRRTAEDHRGAVGQGRLAELVEVDEPRLGVHPVGQGLEVDR